MGKKKKKKKQIKRYGILSRILFFPLGDLITSIFKQLLNDFILAVILFKLLHFGFPDGPVLKNPPANAGEADSTPGLGKFPEGENGNPLQYFGETLEKSNGQRGLAGYSSWGCKESDMTDHTCTPINLDPCLKKFKHL